MTKRQHALHQLLSSERAYASDLALIRDIHLRLALGECLILSFSFTRVAYCTFISACGLGCEVSRLELLLFFCTSNLTVIQ